MKSVRDAWHGLSTTARVTVLCFGWPVALFFLAVLLESHAPRIVRDNEAGVMVLLAVAGALCAQSVKRRRQRQWRETAGRMTETPAAAGRHARPLTDRDRIDENRALIDDAADRLTEAEARLDYLGRRFDGLSEGLITALRAGGTPLPEALACEADTVQIPRRAVLRLVRENEQAG